MIRGAHPAKDDAPRVLIEEEIPAWHERPTRRTTRRSRSRPGRRPSATSDRTGARKTRRSAPRMTSSLAGPARRAASGDAVSRGGVLLLRLHLERLDPGAHVLGGLRQKGRPMKARRSSADKEARIEEALGKLVQARQENVRLREELTRAAAQNGNNVTPLRRRR